MIPAQQPDWQRLQASIAQVADAIRSMAPMAAAAGSEIRKMLETAFPQPKEQPLVIDSAAWTGRR